VMLHGRRVHQLLLHVIVAALTVAVIYVLVANGVYGILNDNVWIMPYAEGFSWSFVPSLKASVPGAYWYHYFGLSGLILLTHGVHWATAILLGSRQFTLEYLTMFGSIFMAAVSVLKLIAVLVLTFSKVDLRVKLATVAFLLMLVFFAPVYGGPYNQILNTLTFFSVYVFAFSVLLAYALGAEKEWIDRQKFRLAAIIGALSGLLFFDMSMWGWLTLFTLAIICARLELRDIPRVLVVTALVGGITGVLALFAAYAGDINAALFAAAAHVRGFTSGTGHGDPGFDFFELFLSRESHLFTEHVLILGAASVLVFSAACLAFALIARHPRLPAWRKVAFDVVFLLSAVAYWHVLNVHPSGTVAEAAGLCAAVYLFFRPALQIVCAGSRGDRIFAAIMALPAVIVIADFWTAFVPSTYHSGLSVAQRLEGQIVRSADAFFNDCADRYTVVNSLEIYSINTIVYALKNTLVSMFTGTIPWDVPNGALEEAYDLRMPRYGFYFSDAIVDIGPRCHVGETVPYPSPTIVPGPVTDCVSLNVANRQLFFNHAPAHPGPRIQDTTLYYALPAPVASAVFNEASSNATWNPFVPGEGKCVVLMQMASRNAAQGLREGSFPSDARGFGWEAISVDPVNLIRRLIDYQIEVKLPPKYVQESDVALAAIMEGRPAIVVRIFGLWDTRYVLLVAPRAETP
jgi:hypothetical protein